MGKRRAEDRVKASKIVKFTDDDENVINGDGEDSREALAAKMNSTSFEELQRIRQSLPIYEARDALVKAIGKAQVSIGIASHLSHRRQP